MTERATSQAAADDADLTVYIARNGAEIGECRRGDVAALVAEGELLKTDHYWHAGMENWQQLEQLLASERPKAPALEVTQRMQIAPPPEATDDAQTARPDVARATSFAALLTRARDALRPAPQAKRSLIIAGAICGGFVVAAVIAILVIRLGHDSTPVRAKTATAAGAPTPIVEPDEVRKLRDKAAADLRGRLESLPSKPAPPLYTFYYDIRVNMRRALSPGAQFAAQVRGSENVVAPESEQTIRRTEFTLLTEYRDGQWTFKHYKASTRHLDHPADSEDEHDERTPTPPPLVSMLGLKIEPPDPDAR